MSIHPESDVLWQRAQRVLAGGPGTFSKHWSRYPQGIAPAYLVSGDGCYVTGNDDKRYIDTVAALGPIILGYNHPVINKAVIKQLQNGTSFSMLHPLEVEVAEMLCDLLPCAEMCRFMRNGTDATNAAVRLARAVTGHQHVLFAGYHGGAMDSYGITTDRAAGILPQLFPYNHQTPWDDLSSISQQVLDDLAAIVVEVPPALWGASKYSILCALAMYQTLATNAGALFVLDEVVTFPRCNLHGAQALYSCLPDLCCVSKAIANGLPLAALVGKRQYMERFNDGDVFVSYTFAGETTALAACGATLDVLQTTDALANLHRHGQALGDGLNDLFRQYDLPVSLWGDSSRLSVRWHVVPDVPDVPENALKTLWLAEHARRGVLHGVGVMLPMACYTAQIVQTLLDIADEVCDLIAHALSTGRVMEALPCPLIDNVLSVR